MLIANKIGKKPREVAELIIENLPPEKDELFNKIEIAGPGFINFYVKEESIVNKLLEIETGGEKFGTSNIGNGEKVLVEFVSANPTGFLHMGHSRNAVVGDTVARILSACGYDVVKEFYINDAGRQMNLLGESVFIRYKELFGHSEELSEDGYKGRIGIHEALKISTTIKEIILRGGSSDEIETQAKKEGMMTMIEDGIFQAIQGQTTIDEVLRVVSE